jgi:transposase
MRSKGSAHELEQRRLLAVRRVRDGWTQKDVAEFLGVSPRAVGAWVAAWRRGGDGALGAKPHPGAAPRLSAAQEADVLGCLRRPAADFGFPSDLWTARRVAQLIADRHRVAFNPDYLRQWLAKRHYSPQKPAGRPRERDEEAIAGWAADGWQRLKKKRRRKRPTSSRSTRAASSSTRWCGARGRRSGRRRCWRPGAGTATRCRRSPP